MAEIVYGFGSSHGPLLSTPADMWHLRAGADRKNRALAYRDGTYEFDELLALRNGQGQRFEPELELDVRQRRFDECQRHMDVLADKLEEVDPEVVVLVGDDQHEWFGDDIQPSYLVYYGDEIVNTKLDPTAYEKAPPGIAISAAANHPGDADHHYPVAGELARRIIEHAINDEFDVASSDRAPQNGSLRLGVGHAVGFIYRRILRDKPRLLVPILINTFFPPNQPTPGRCYDFGRSIGRAIKSWNGPKRVCVCASGGLSHFVIDEEWDERIFNAIRDRDENAIRNEPNIMFRSGTSETKNWITAMGILAETELEMDMKEYVPCYRSEAGTGNAMAFATWQ